MRDQGSCCRYPNNYTNTKTKTIYEFCDLYSGAEFILHIFSSTVMSIVFVTATYSCMMPVMNVLTMGVLAMLYIM